MSTFNKLGQLFSQKALRSLSAGVAVSSIMLGLGAFAKPASAVTIAGYELNETADQLLATYGNFTTSGGTLQSVLLDQDVATYAYSFTPGAFVKLGFSNGVINALGDDLALFDLGIADAFSVTINNVQKIYSTADTGYSTGGVDDDIINVATINLDDFGIASGGFIYDLIIGLDNKTPLQTVPSLAVIGSLNGRSVPEPSAMFGVLATAGFLACQRKLKLVKKA
ncbi:hypothetical protein [Anabaena azotica]|uniref:hypothetical protein n=1 Tax=Anabaena azotica TaxID=197653 RepID=UPI0039A5AF07